LNSADTHEANSNAISLCAKLPPFLPDLEIIPMALVFIIHFLGDRVNVLEPDSLIKESNSTPLK